MPAALLFSVYLVLLVFAFTVLVKKMAAGNKPLYGRRRVLLESADGVYLRVYIPEILWRR